MNSTRRRASNGSNGAGSSNGTHVVETVVAASLSTGLDMQMSHPEPVDRIAAADAIERALRHLPNAAVVVVGRQAAPVARWLRQTGRDARAATPHEHLNAPVIFAAGLDELSGGAECLGALQRMLAPDGLLLAMVPNLTHARARIAMLLGRYTGRSNGSGPAFTLRDVERMFQDAAFTVIDIERQMDGLDALKQMGEGVPEPVVNLLANDLDAMTSYFVVVAEPQQSASVGRCHRRITELADAHRTTARGMDRVEGRVAELEVRVQHWSGETNRLALRDVTQSDGTPREATDRIEREMRALSDRLTSERNFESGRDAEALNQAREALLKRTGEVKALASRIEQARYRREIERIREAVTREVPRGSIVAVISRGDDDLLVFKGRRGWLFPMTEKGVYAGHHPADSKAAIGHVEQVRARGAAFLVVPRSAFWWLDHYKGFGEYLERMCRCVWRDDRTCALFSLRKGRQTR